MEQEKPKDVVLQTTADAIRLGKTILRTARSAAIATIDPDSGRPVATRVGMSTDSDGTPTILISAMTAHFKGLRADPRCSLLIGEPGRGDPLAYARMTVHCDAAMIDPDSADKTRIAGRYLAHSPKAKLYAGLGDFRFWRLEIKSGALNGGFGRAYNLSADELLTNSPANAEIAEMEASAVEHMNEDHFEAVGLYATQFAKGQPGNWTLLGLDAEGVDVGLGDDVRRVFFPEPLTSAGDVRMALMKMAGEARQALKQTA